MSFTILRIVCDTSHIEKNEGEFQNIKNETVHLSTITCENGLPMVLMTKHEASPDEMRIMSLHADIDSQAFMTPSELHHELKFVVYDLVRAIFPDNITKEECPEYDYKFKSTKSVIKEECFQGMKEGQVGFVELTPEAKKIIAEVIPPE